MIASLHRFADWLVLLYGWKRALTAFCAGAFMTLALPPVFALPVLFVSLPVLALLLDGADADPAESRGWRKLFGRPGFFAVGFWFGFGWFFASLYWIAEALTVEAAIHGWLIPFALTLIPAGLAVTFGVATALAGFFWSGGPWRLIVLAGALTACEMVRGVVFTGFPWNGLHLPLVIHPLLMQGFSVVGPAGATFVLTLIALAPSAMWPQSDRRVSRRVYAAVAIVLTVGWTSVGVLRLAGEHPPASSGITVHIVQPNIAQADKWDPALRDRHFASLLDLTQQSDGPAGLGLLAATHVFWPESAFPFLLTQRPDALTAIGSVLPLGANLITGALRSESQGSERVFFNAIYALNDRGEIIDAYDKVRLVPFGEQLPFADTFDRLGLRPIVGAPAGFAPGSGHGTLQTPAAPSGLGLVCYEAIFSGFVRDGVRTQNPGYLINLTNDAWFGHSIGPVQHFHQARLRAVETGKPLVRAANTGISGVVDAHGRIVKALGVDTRGVLTASLPEGLTGTVYLRFGHLPVHIALLTLLIVSIYHRRTNGRDIILKLASIALYRRAVLILKGLRSPLRSTKPSTFA